MTGKNFAPSPILICMAALITNLIGSFVAKNFNLPLFLDTGGTIFIAMMSGYVPGVIVGFATNFFYSFVEESDMYYCSISILVALYTTFLARRGIFQNFSKTLVAIPVLALLTTVCTESIEKFLYCTGVVEAFSEIQTNFFETFLREFVDKGLLVLIMFVVIKFVPAQIKEIFRTLGQRQAPLTKEIRRAVYKRKCPSSSLRTRILLILTLSSLFIAASIASISYRIFEQAATNVQIKIADGLAHIVTSEINSERVEDYIKFGRTAAGYDDVEKKLRYIKDSNSDLKNLRVEKISAAGNQIIFNTEKISSEKNFSYCDDLIAGKEIAPIITDDGNDRLLTIYKPVRDHNGQCICYVAVDMSLNLISDYGRTFTSKVLALFSGCFVFVFVIGLRFVENNIVLPVNSMAYCANNFAYDSKEYCANNVEQIQRLDIHTGDEILLKTTQDAQTNFEKLRRAKRQVAEMDELAHKDSLTGLKNKAAYDEKISALDKKISANGAEFCIAMVDVNYLKRVNDTYGHERGNEYLINAGKLICSVFGEEHVYRIGGDEFVVVIEGEKVSLCKYFVTQFQAEMARKNSNKLLEPWEKISAAVGISFYEPDKDKTADEVFKRADSEMYKNKLAMKAARTD